MVVGVGFFCSAPGRTCRTAGRQPVAKDAGGEFVLGGGHSRWVWGNGMRLSGVVCQAHAVAVGLEAVVAVALHAWRSGADAGEDAGVGVAGDFVGADGFVEPVGVVEDADLDAVPGFVVDAVASRPTW